MRVLVDLNAPATVSSRRTLKTTAMLLRYESCLVACSSSVPLKVIEKPVSNGSNMYDLILLSWASIPMKSG